MSETARPQPQGSSTTTEPPEEDVGATLRLQGASTPTGPEPALELPVERERYASEGVLARGGSGRILRARDRRLQRTVALKELLHPEPHARRRFLAEALVTARLQHPAIVPVYDAGRLPEGDPFYVMKLVSGRPLSEVVQSAPTLSERLALLPHVLAVAEAMGYAHSQRVIHRDLKPANILVGEFGETVVIDWGLAKELGRPEEPDTEVPTPTPTPPASVESTHQGLVMGTPAYMPPEQAAGQPVDERADVYALGAILYTVLAGRPPYSGASSQEVLKQVLEQAPEPLGRLQPEAPAELLTIAARAMAREPSQRYPSARELAEDLRRFQTGQLVSAHRYSTWELGARFIRRHRAALAVIAVALVASLVQGTLAVQRIIAARDRAEQAELEVGRRADERTLEQARSSLAHSPERTLELLGELSPAFERWGAVRTVAADALAQGLATHLLRDHTRLLNRLAFSADGRHLLTTSDDRTVRLWHLPSGTSRVLETFEDEVWAAAFSPDGRHVASGGKDTSVRLRDLQSGALHVLQGHTAPVFFLFFSPEGRRLFSGGFDGQVRAWEVGSGTGRLVGAHEGGLDDLALLPDGRRLASVSMEDGTLRLWDLEAGSELLRLRWEAPPTAMAASRRTGVLAVGSEDGHVALWEPDTRGLRRLEVPREPLPSAVINLTFSSQGSHLAAQTRAGHTLLWDLERPGAVRLLEQSAMGWASALSFSPDGRWLAAGGRDGKGRLWEVASGRVRLLHGAKDTISHVAFSADSRWVASASHDGVARLYEVVLAHERVLHLHPGGVHGALLTQEGRAVLSAGLEGQVRLWPLGEGTPLQVQAHPTGLTAAAYSDNGRRLATAGREGRVALWSESAEVLRWLQGPTRQVEQLALSGDGARVAAVEGLGGSEGAQGSEDVWLWEEGATEGQRLVRQWRAVHVLALSASGRHLALGGEEHGVWLYDIEKGGGRWLHRHKDRVQALAFSPNGSYLASGSRDHTIFLQALGSGESRLLEAGGIGIRALLFSRDGRTLYSASMGDNAVRQWQVETGEQGLPLHAPAQEVNCMALSPEGRRLVTGGLEGTVRLWDLESGESRALPGHEGHVQQVAFSADGTRVYSAGSDGTVRVWEDGLPLEPHALRAWLGRLSGR